MRPRGPALRIRRVTRSTSRPSTRSSSRAACAGRARGALCEPNERRPRRAPHAARVAEMRERVEPSGPRRVAEVARPAPRSGAPATSPTVAMPARVQPRRGRRADAPDPLDRQRVEELALAAGRDDEQPVGLRRPARHLRQHLRPRDPDAERQPELLADLAPQPLARSPPACRRSARGRRRRGTPPRASGPRRAARSRGRSRRAPGSPRRRR